MFNLIEHTMIGIMKLMSLYMTANICYPQLDGLVVDNFQFKHNSL